MKAQIVKFAGVALVGAGLWWMVKKYTSAEAPPAAGALGRAERRRLRADRVIDARLALMTALGESAVPAPAGDDAIFVREGVTRLPMLARWIEKQHDVRVRLDKRGDLGPIGYVVKVV